jgi:imidazolonepropionase-like amidohydrolase
MPFERQAMADGVPAMLAAIREQLMQGASQIKLATGVMSAYGRIDDTEYSLDELQAAVGAAGTGGRMSPYIAYTMRSGRRVIEAGVKSIEHG